VRELAVVRAVRAAHGRVPRRRIAGAVVDEVQGGVVGPDGPRDGAAVLPGVALPRIVAGLAGAGHRVEAPHLAPVRPVVGRDVPARAILAAAQAGDHEVLGERGRRRDDRALRVIDEPRPPRFLAGRRAPPYTGQPPDCAWAVTARTRTTANAMTDERAGLFIESLLDGGDSGTSLPSLFGELRGQCVMRSKSKRETRAGSRTLSSAAGPRPDR